MLIIDQPYASICPVFLDCAIIGAKGTSTSTSIYTHIQPSALPILTSTSDKPNKGSKITPSTLFYSVPLLLYTRSISTVLSRKSLHQCQDNYTLSSKYLLLHRTADLTENPIEKSYQNTFVSVIDLF